MRSDEDSLRRLARDKGQGPSEVNGTDGTAAYQETQTLKKLVRLSNVRQIVLKYMDEEGNVTLPTSGTASGGPSGSGGSSDGLDGDVE